MGETMSPFQTFVNYHEQRWLRINHRLLAAQCAQMHTPSVSTLYHTYQAKHAQGEVVVHDGHVCFHPQAIHPSFACKSNKALRFNVAFQYTLAL